MSNIASPPAASNPGRRALLAERLRKAASENAPRPLSFAQQRLWFIDQLEPNTALYNIATVAGIHGRLDATALERAINAIIARHESLRTRFVRKEEAPEQIVDPAANLALLRVTVPGSTREERDSAARSLVKAEVGRPFDLSSDLLIRAQLLHLEAEEHLLLVVMHHIVSDEWSLKVLFRELAAFYRQFSEGTPHNLPELTIQYTDYAAWQRKWMQGEVFETQLSYWKKQLADHSHPTELLCDFPRRSVPCFKGGNEIRELNPALSENVRQFAKNEQATLFMVALAAFNALVYRYTGSEDVVVGSPIAGRNRVETEGLIGFFVNTLALRTRLDGNLNFKDLIKRVRETTLGAYAHQDLPFEQVVENLKPERSLSHMPFSRLMFVVQNNLLQEMTLPGIKVNFFDVESEFAKFDITLVVQEISGGLVFRAEYNSGLFERATIARLLQHLEILLAGAIQHPQQRISELPLLSPEERNQLLIQWNNNSSDYPRNKCIHELFQQQAQKTPNACALRFGTRTISYRELNERANQLAHYLHRFPIAPDVPVGICVERSEEMVVGVLGILKAGGAYVPLDPGYPDERLDFMMQDTQTPVLLTQQSLRSKLSHSGAEVICLDGDWDLIARESRENPPNLTTSESLAYVMYTSGSTGQPKGVAIPHRAVNRLVLNTNYIEINSTDRIAQVSNFSFDAATFEIWGALLNGAQLIGIKTDLALSPADFAAEIKLQGITAIFLTSALFSQLATQVPGAFETLRTAMAGGDALESRQVRAVLNDRPPRRLVNGYGPTENTTFTCCYEIQEIGAETTNIPIGRPISNTQVYILDRNMNPVPIGVPGELYTGGDGLAHGYWRRPELTAQKFVDNPFAGNQGSLRLYRSGDLARYRADGVIEFLGRIDYQVKIRGFRIELGEIEAVLSQSPQVRECVVKVCGEDVSSKRLVAYVAPTGKDQINTSDLRSFLMQKLPDYMVPSVFMQLKALPLTSNGKVDRKALPEPDMARPWLERKYTPPRDAVENELARIWEKILNVHPIGIHDKFFDLGGHSLLAVRVIAKIESAFGKKLKLATIFQAQTVEQLAAVVRNEIIEGALAGQTSLVEIQSRGVRPPLFLVHGAGGGMFWGYVNLSRHLGPDQPVYGFKSRGLDGREELGSMEEMARQYVADLRVLQPHGPYFLGGYCFGGNVAYEMARQLQEQGEKVGLLGLFNCAPPNSSYLRVDWSPQWWKRFFHNLVYYINYFHSWTPTQRRELFKWKWSLLKKRFRNFFRHKTETENVDVGDLVDLASFTTEQRKVWESHIQSLIKYHPKEFRGDVHLFRSAGHPLWCSFDPQYGWGDLVRGEIKIHVVPGAHEKILEEPLVITLAKILQDEVRNCLEPSTAPASGPASSGPPAQRHIPRANFADQSPPLSLAQKRLWLLNELEPRNPVYTRVAGCRIQGAIKEKTLEKAWNRLVLRHSILRTSYHSKHGVPEARIHPSILTNLRVVTLGTGSFKEQASELQALANSEQQKFFDLATAPLVRVTLARLGDRDFALLLIAHEMVADEKSLELLGAQLLETYRNEVAGETKELAGPEIEYPDFAAWESSNLAQPKSIADSDYWKGKLSGAPALLELPTDFPRPAHQSYGSRESCRQLPPDLARRMKEMAEALGSNPSILYLTVVVLFLRRYTGQEDLVVGVPLEQRESPEVQSVIGNLANFLALRFGVNSEMTFAELLDKVQSTKADASAHGDLPFEKVIEDLRLARDKSYHPVFQVTFDYHSKPPSPTGGGDFTISKIALDTNTNKFDLTFLLVEDSEGTLLKLKYATDLFSEETIERMLVNWMVLLDGISQNPRELILKLPLLSDAERNTVLTEWNDNALAYPQGKTLIQLFEEQVAKTPDLEALIWEKERITYAQLQVKVDRIARYLRSHGVENQSLVGVCMHRCPDLLAGILGILKAGAAYVPMDPAYPRDRILFMLEDSQAKVLLTQESLLSQFAGSKSALLCVEEGLRMGTTDLADWNRPAAEDLAYVIYTSGSTGKPKGVALEHRNAVSFVFWARSVFNDEELSGVLAATSICFDLSIYEMFVPLSFGGKIILAENAISLANLAAAHEVRIVNTVPSAMRELIRIDGVPDSVKVVNLAGEPLPTPLVDQIYRQTAVQKVFDLYGPTETTTYSTYTLRQPGLPATIGRPLANEQVYLLDALKQPAPIGVPGEVYIGGAGVARGYLHRPEMTGERFLENPFLPGQRVYRTGDLARWRADGNIEFLGRIDNQVKIRGFRIELGEIENGLKKLPGIKDAAVMAREDERGNKRLVAYVVGNAEVCVPESLRSALKQKLPEYMVPGVFVFLPELPMTPNGKIDRKALPKPELETNVEFEQSAAPENDLERQIAETWKEVLSLSQVGRRDNFFDLGGHSLLAIQVIARLREKLAKDVSLSALFDAPTIESLAQLLHVSESSGGESEPGLSRLENRADAPLSFVQERLWFLNQIAPESDAYNMPTTMYLSGKVDFERLEQALNRVINRHEALRTTFSQKDGVLRQVISDGLEIQIQRQSFLSLGPVEARASAEKWLAAEAQKPFDLSKGPLVRASIAQSARDQFVLGITMHHIISDGWSLGIFFKELADFYQKFENPEALTFQYADYAAWQRKWMTADRLEKDLSFWKSQLKGAPTAIALPVDKDAAVSDTGAGRHHFAVGAAEMAALTNLAQKEKTTLYTVLMTALAITLRRWARQDDLVIGSVMAGRNQREVEQLIGCFMNFVPIRANSSGAETGLDLLRKIRVAMIDAQMHQNCPFEKMVEALNPERHVDQNPLYNVALLLQNYPGALFQSEDFSVSRGNAQNRDALLDLRFEAEQEGDQLSILCEYRQARFKSETIRLLVCSLKRVLIQMAGEPEQKLDEYEIEPELIPRTAVPSEKKLKLAISGTFTVEPIEDGLNYWFKELELNSEIEFAPYNQVFQQLLDPSSALAQNRSGVNLLLIRILDWARSDHSPSASFSEKMLAEIEHNSHEFVAALRPAVLRGGVPYLVCLCPPPPGLALDARFGPRLKQIESDLLQQLKTLGSVYVTSTEELRELYPVTDYYDASGDELGHVPYTPEFFSALATMVARNVHCLSRPAHKVIVLDLDQTLWSGVCGEDGAMGIRLDDARLALQKFMLRQYESGMLLCVCSKNNEEDVNEVFRQRVEMPLQRNHFIGWRVNWNAKSKNIRSLAKELNLGLDSFIFLDDNPVECAEVEANCPEVLTLLLPEQTGEIKNFLKHCWVFDHLKITDEDRKRADMYRQNQQREKLRTEASGLGDFLAGLDLSIRIERLAAANYPRASQLTQRTNQFNFTTVRRSEGEMQKFLVDGEGLVVTVSDRFGDYGLVGVMLFRSERDTLRIDTFLLSCRVLGRGVEHRMLSRLGEIARERRLDWVVAPFVESGRNKPAFVFLEGIGSAYRAPSPEGVVYRFPAGYAQEVALNVQGLEQEQISLETETSPKPLQNGTALVGAKFARCRTIALERNNALKIHRLIDGNRVGRAERSSEYEAPATDIENKLCEIWKDLLRVEKVGVTDNFFDLGGHSLLAVRLFAKIEKEVGTKFPLVTLFQAPTVRQLAGVISAAQGQRSHSLIVPIQPLGSRPPLFLVHGAGGDVLWGYANLASHLGKDQPIYGIKSLGQLGQEEPASVEEMAAFYLAEVRTFQASGPYYLGGYCFGGNVAYEMARQLKEQGEEVALLALLDSTPSNAGYEKIRWWNPGFIPRFLVNIKYWIEDFAGIQPEEKRIFVRRKVRSLGRKVMRLFGTGKGSRQVDLEEVINPGQFPAHELKLWQAHLNALVAHVQRPYDGDVLLLRTRGQALLCSLEEDFCWGHLIGGRLEVHQVPGSHENIFLEPHVAELAKQMANCLGHNAPDSSPRSAEAFTQAPSTN